MPKVFAAILSLFACLTLQSQVDRASGIEYDTTIEFQDANRINFDLDIEFPAKGKIALFFKNRYAVDFKSQDPDLKLIVTDSAFGKKVSAHFSHPKNITNLHLNYSLKIPDSVKSRNFLFEPNQLLLLPDFDYLPHVLHDVSKVTYKFNLKGNQRHAYIDGDFKSVSAKIPYVLSGNFKIKGENRITSFIPNGLAYNEARYLSILKIVNASYEFFSKTYGIPNDKKEFKVFFLNRSGGHGFSSGLILDQVYLSGSDKLNNKLKLLIAHEVAHYWWGNTIETNQSSLFEGLAEYSATLFMQDVGHFEIRHIYADKNFQLEINPIAKIQFDTIDAYDFQNNLYRAFSYLKLPIILRALESKIGKENLTSGLKSVFLKYKSSGELLSYSDFIEVFKIYGADDLLRSEIIETTKNWTDYYIKSVTDKVVVYGVTGWHDTSPISVALTSGDNKTIYDSIDFGEKNEVIKKYDFEISSIKIDPEFLTSQLTTLNDTYNSKRTDATGSKYEKIYEDKYYLLADKLTAFLFYGGLAPGTFASGSELQSKLAQMSETTRKITLNGWLMYVDKKKNKLKIKISFATPTQQNSLGFIDFSYTEKDNAVYLTAIDRIKL
jgi:hypothetical protein